MSDIRPERLEKLIEVIKKNKFSTVDQLCGILNVPPTIITPTMNIAQIFLGSNFKILLSGGLLSMESDSLVGQLAIDSFSKLKADIAFMSCESITNDLEVMYPDLELMQIKKAVINSAVIKILLVDSSKFGRVSLSTLGDLSLFDLLITDDEIEKKYLKELEKRNIKFGIAS